MYSDGVNRTQLRVYSLDYDSLVQLRLDGILKPFVLKKHIVHCRLETEMVAVGTADIDQVLGWQNEQLFGPVDDVKWLPQRLAELRALISRIS